MQVLDFVGGAAVLVHLGSLLSVIGFLNRNQLVLRTLTLSASAVFVVYYVIGFDTPLWESIFWNCVLSTANAIGIVRVILDRRAKHPSDQHAALMAIMQVLSPAEFRRLMQIAQWRVAEQPLDLTREGEVSRSLYFIIGGQVGVERNGREIPLGPGTFVGEISFMTNEAATADVRAPAGTEYIEWPRDALCKTIERTPGLGSSLERLFNQELTRKLMNSWAAAA